MKTYKMVYTSNNGDIIEVEYIGTVSMLLYHIKALEAYNCHSFYVTDGRTPVYANNKLIATDTAEKFFSLTFTGNDGSHQEQDYYGTSTALVQHISALEELGCHGFTATDGDRVIYDNGGLL